MLKKGFVAALTLGVVTTMTACSGDTEQKVMEDKMGDAATVIEENADDAMMEGKEMVEAMMDGDRMDEGGEEVVIVGGEKMYPSKDIIDNAVNSADHTTLVAAVKAAGLVETLKGDGPFTVFAPTNAAFDALPAGTVEELLKTENAEQLKAVLTYHVIADRVVSEALVGMIEDGEGSHSATTVQGGDLKFYMENGSVMIEDESGNKATVTIADVEQSNGVIHVIDTVLIPAS